MSEYTYYTAKSGESLWSVYFDYVNKYNYTFTEFIVLNPALSGLTELEAGTQINIGMKYNNDFNPILDETGAFSEVW